jgi:hypothetical protein
MASVLLWTPISIALAVAWAWLTPTARGST